jgi:hypothetical protein
VAGHGVPAEAAASGPLPAAGAAAAVVLMAAIAARIAMRFTWFLPVPEFQMA